MKNINQAIAEKMQQIEQLQLEIAALKQVVPLFAEPETEPHPLLLGSQPARSSQPTRRS